MNNKNENKLIITVANIGFADDVVETSREFGATGATVLMARGTGMKNTSFFGIKIEPEKEVILSVVESDKCEKIIEGINKKHGLNTPTGSISFSLPIDMLTTINKEELNNEEKPAEVTTGENE